MFFKKVLVLGMLCLGLGARASVIAPDIRERLVKKLQKIYSTLPANHPSRVAVVLRLADLLSEQARYNAMMELQKGCLQCTAGEVERKQALKYYLEVIPRLSKEQKVKALGQVGHLYELLGQQSLAIQYYQSVTESPHYSEKKKAEAFLSLGEIYFKNHRYAKALQHYNLVLNTKGVKNKSLAAYRRAWSLFNLGQVSQGMKALIKIVKTPELLMRESGDAKSIRQYQAEVTRDLATFMAKNRVGLSQAKLLYQLSPNETKLDNLTTLASALERVGEISQSLQISRFLIEKQQNQQKNLEAYIRAGQLEKALGNTRQAVLDYQKALQLRAAMGTCQEDKCSEWESSLRKFILDWHREKQSQKSPPQFLLQSYQAYLKVFPLEVDMHIWYAQALQTKKGYASAYSAYDTIIDLITSGRGKKGANNRDNLPSLEKLLLARVELGEKLDKGPFLQKAYTSYLEQSQEKTRWVAVNYQLAYRIYKKGEYQNAALAFKNITSMKTDQSPPELRKKAADLALDSLALLKDDKRLEEWTGEFAALFPKAAKGYRAMGRKSLFNQVFQSATKNLKASWAILEKINLAEANSQEKLDYYRNKLVLAEKLNKFPEAQEAANQFLSLEKISEKDRQFALSRKAWLAEMLFDFETALTATQKLNLSELEPEQKTLKLALLAELSGKNSTPYYRRYLKLIKDKKRVQAVALKLVKISPKPLQELLQQRKRLVSNRNQFASMYLNEIAQSNAKTFQKHSSLILKDRELSKTPTGTFLWRQRFISQYQKAKDKISRHQIVHKTQRKLSRTLTQRVKMLEKIDTLLKRAVKKQDWTTQVIALDLLSTQSSRFYQEIISLPVPQGLTEAEQTEYLGLLSQQASPYQVQAEKLSKKLTEFWAYPNLLEQWQKQYQSSTAPVRKILAREAKLLAQISPEKFQKPLLKVLDYKETAQSLPKANQVASLRVKVSQDPLNIDLLNDLLNVEKKFGQTTMVSYLESRIEKLKSMSQGEV